MPTITALQDVVFPIVYGKIDPKVKAAWVKGLRSKEYRQGKKVLCKTTRVGNDNFCCLGVVFDVAATDRDARWLPVDHEAGEVTWSAYYGREGASARLPFDFSVKIGLTNEAENMLVKMNDGGDSFAKIADWIEKTL